MIIYDISNIFFEVVHSYYSKESKPLTKDLLRGLMLERLAFFGRKFKKYSDKQILAFDSRNGYWRRDYFKPYKVNRKLKRDQDEKIDWNTILTYFNEIVEEWKVSLPFYCLQIDKAEADDIFATICFRYALSENHILIISSDEDIVQLQTHYSNISQYSLKRRAMITKENTKYDLFDHIVKGDSGDGIPNIKSHENILIEKTEKQKSIYKTELDKWRVNFRYPEKFCDEQMLERFKVNQMIIDFGSIPMEIIDAIDSAYKNYKLPKQKMFDYFIKHRLTKMMGDFK